MQFAVRLLGGVRVRAEGRQENLHVAHQIII